MPVTRDPLTEVADDVFQLRLPLPFALNHVNVYLLRGEEGWAVVDCGIHYAAGEAAWREALARLGLGFGDIRQIVLTHAHPDHYGMAGWLQARIMEETGELIPVQLSEREAQFVEVVWVGEYQQAAFQRYIEQTGVPDEQARIVADSMGHTRRMTRPLAERLTHIAADSVIKLGGRHFRAIHAPGHADGQLLFYDEADRLLLSGDHVLMKITPNIGVWQHSDPDPLGRFLASLRALAGLDVRLALPGHRRLIEDWRGRLDELLVHHEARLGHTLDALAKGATTVYEVSLHVFESERFTAHEWRFAVAETLAHLERLRLMGQAQCEGDRWRLA